MKSILQKKINNVIVALLFFVSFFGYSQTTVSYTAMTTITCPATPVATISSPPVGLTFSQISRGSGVTCGAAAGSISGSGYNGTLAANVTASKWYTYSITSDAATSFTLNTLNIVGRVSNVTVSPNVSVQYSIGAGAKTVIGTYTPTTSSATYTITPSAPINVAANEVLNIFIIPNGLTAAGTTCRVENNTSANVTATTISASPTVTTTSPATGITTMAATLSGNVINIGASAILANGIVFSKTNLDATPTIGEANVTNLATASPSISTGIFSNTTSGLSANEQYTYNAYATNTQGTSYGTTASFYTLANVPNFPFLANVSSTTIAVGLNGGNPNPSTQYAIQVNGGLYVQANGTLGATATWQTHTLWGFSLETVVTGLTPNTLYSFAVKARNGANVETTFSGEVSETTLPNVLATLSLVGASPAFGSLCLNTTSAAQSFSFDGVNLNSTDFSIAALSGYSFSTTEFGTYTPTVTITNAATTVSGQLVWVKFNPTAILSYNNNISITGGGLPTAFSIPVTGSGVNTASTTITGSASAISAVAAQLSGSYTVGCSPVSTYGFEISTTAGFANGSGTPIASINQVTGAFSGSISGLNANTTYYYKSVATDASGTVYGTQSSFTTANLLAPIATLASAVTQNEFVANWNSVVGATSYNLDVSASPTFGTVANATDLIISEYVEGSSSNKVIELYNGTGASVNLADYSIKKQTNGAGAFASDLALSGTLSNGATYVIAFNLASPAILALANLTTNSAAINFNGNDAVGLYKLGAQIDVVGIVNQVTPNWGDNRTLVRKSSVLSPTSAYSVSDWNSLAIDFIANIGSHVMNGTIGSFLSGYENLSVVGTSQVVTGLTANTPYYYRVRASNATSTSNNSNTILVNTVNTSNLTSLVAANCNSTLSSIGTTIYATPKANATGYRFEVTNLNTNAVQVKDKPLQFFRLTELANYDYATTYSVKVMLKVGTEFVGYYGDTCLVTTPGLGSPTQSNLGVVSPICGSIIPINTTIYTTPLAGVTGYRFRVKTASQVDHVLDRTLQFFAFNSLPTYVYGATYTVEVAVKTTGDYTPYGPVCTFTTTTPTIAAATCGTTIPNTGVVYATPLAGVTSYVFTVTNLNTPETFAPIVRTNQFFSVSLIPSYSTSTPYSISVAVVTGGQQSASGTACTINPVAEARQTNTTENIDFKAVGYPNPFASNFTLEITSNTIENVFIQIYDMLGSRVETKLANPSESKAISFGNDYASGVYNVVVTQGDIVKSLRMIKR